MGRFLRLSDHPEVNADPAPFFFTKKEAQP